ncbi:MAG TPA: 3-hydroxyacyl-CoA dehydrogenase NAD-binding domain-containing protein [Burkholderiales bacterium]|nr:3-hydroxyacyl-CoA dehydrogenase NAD-binding domain-containing protein [Burkholderiales bacterium]
MTSAQAPVAETTAPAAVVGAGLMGHGIAVCLAMAGRPVAVHDPEPRALESLVARVRTTLAMLEANPTAADRVRTCADLADAMRGAAFVIEAGPERLEVKQRIFEALDRLAPLDAVLASNTSAIPIGDIGARVRDRSRVVGWHFWNPPYAVRLVEVVQATETSAEVIARSMSLLHTCGMIPVHVKRDVPGFIGNRLQHALKREAIALVADGVCDAETLDLVVREGFGARLAVLGPLEQSDMIGLGLTLDIHRVLMPHLDRTPVPHPLLEAKVAAGETGMTTGKGFRAWTPAEAEAVRERFRRFVAAQGKAAARR